MIKYPLSFLILTNWLAASVFIQETTTTTTTYQRPRVVYVKQYTEAEMRERERQDQYYRWKMSLTSRDRDFVRLYNSHVSIISPDIYEAQKAIYRFNLMNEEEQDNWMKEMLHREYVDTVIAVGIIVTIVAVTATIIYKYDLLVPICCFASAYNNVYGCRPVVVAPAITASSTTTATIYSF